MKNKILMIIAPSDFRDEELLVPKRFFEGKHIKVDVASETREKSRGMLGAISTPDLTIDGVDVGEYDAVVFVGGAGVDKHRFYENERCLNIAKNALMRGKVLAAICLASKTLANAGLLRKRKATCFNSAINYIKEKGAIYIDKGVVRDINIITADGPGAAQEFAEEIYKYIKSRG